VEGCWVEASFIITSSKLGVDLKTHFHSGSFEVTAKSDKKRARSYARNGGETAVLMACG
jgi:hypothetical protein